MFTRLGLPMNRYTFVLPKFRKPKRFRSLARNLPVYIVIVTQGHILSKDLQETLKNVDKFSEFK